MCGSCFPDYGDYESDSEIIANAHAMDWQLRDDLLAATKVPISFILTNFSPLVFYPKVCASELQIVEIYFRTSTFLLFGSNIFR